MKKHLFTLVMLALVWSDLLAVTFTPVAYYQFEPGAETIDSEGGYHLMADPGYPIPEYSTQEGAVGQYLTTVSRNIPKLTANVPLSTGDYSIEWIMRLNSTGSVKLSSFPFFTGPCKVEFNGFTLIPFSVRVVLYFAAGGSQYFDFRLLAGGPLSWEHYMDGNWHHVAVTYNQTSGEVSVYLDGTIPDPTFTQTVATPGPLLTTGSGFTPLDVTSSQAYGNFDEIAVYDETLSPTIIYKHYLEAITSGMHYTFEDDYSGPLTPISIAGSYDPQDFDLSNGSLEQMQAYPLPRYGRNHGLNRNMPWIHVPYLALDQPGPTRNQYSVDVLEEMVRHWNYYLHITNAVQLFGGRDEALITTPGTFHQLVLDLANNHPEWPSSATMLWETTDPRYGGFSTTPGPYVRRSTLPAESYLQDRGTGRFLYSSKKLSPATPMDSFMLDAKSNAWCFKNITDQLPARPVDRKIDIINDNNENFPLHVAYPVDSLLLDINVVNDHTASGLMDWALYQGDRKANIKGTFADTVRHHYPGLENTKFTWYNEYGGQNPWEEIREASSTFNGKYYATTSQYLSVPFYFKGIMGFVDHTLNKTGPHNDNVFSPFVGGGSNSSERYGCVPSQYLGYLKLMNVAGSDFYYVFHGQAAGGLIDPKRYIWQFSSPPYAQAITSRFEEILNNGFLVDGNAAAISHLFDPVQAGGLDHRPITAIRKHNATDQFVIATSMQRVGNTAWTGTAEQDVEISTAVPELAGTPVPTTMKFKTRRQGSTYYYDLTEPANPVFYQLDKWHESTHPSYWSKNFHFEAEVYDAIAMGYEGNYAPITAVPAGTPDGDFREFTTYTGIRDFVGVITAGGSPVLYYDFQPRGTVSQNYTIWVKARTTYPSAVGISAQVDGGARFTSLIAGNEFKWYQLKSAGGNFFTASPIKHELLIAPNIYVDIDQVELVAECGMSLAYRPHRGQSCPAVYPGYAKGSYDCTTLAIDITGGTPPFSYVWSTGATTDQISVCPAATTSYDVLVTDAAGCEQRLNMFVNVIDVSCYSPRGQQGYYTCYIPTMTTRCNPIQPPGGGGVVVFPPPGRGGGGSFFPPGPSFPPSPLVPPLMLPPGSFRPGPCHIDPCNDLQFPTPLVKTMPEPMDEELSRPEIGAYPNPFAEATTIRFVMPRDDEVVISIYNAVGARVAILFHDQVDQGIPYEAAFHKGSLSGGVYYYEVQTASGYRFTDKLVLIK